MTNQDLDQYLSEFHVDMTKKIHEYKELLLLSELTDQQRRKADVFFTEYQFQTNQVAKNLI